MEPCGHSGVCLECMTKILREKNICPICKTVLKKVYTVKYDEEEKCLKADGELQLKPF